MQRIPLYQYVAINNPQGSAAVIKNFNLRKPENENDLIRGLKHVMNNFGEEGFIEIAKQHPDRHLILDAEDISNPKTEVMTTEKKCSCHSKFSGVDGNSNNGVNAGSDYLAPTKENIRFLTKGDLDKFETEKKVAEMEKKLTKEDISAEVKKVLAQSNNFITQNLPTIAIIGGVIFLYTQMKKN